MSQLIDTPIPWWQVMAIGRNPRTTLIRLAITLVIVFVGFRMSIQPILVQGISMQPTYRDGQRRFLNKLAYRSAQPQRGDVIGIREAGKQVLLLKHARSQRLGAVAGQHRHHRLRQNLPVVQLGRDLVHCGTGLQATGINRTLVRVEPGESR